MLQRRLSEEDRDLIRGVMEGAVGFGSLLAIVFMMAVIGG